MNFLQTACAAAAVVLAALPLAAQQPPFTLQQIMSRPHPKELSTSPAGGLVAWVLNEEGKRNIYVAGPPEYRPHQITRYAEDDGQDISDLAWSPDGKTIVYVRGGAANRMGDFPNPRSDPEGTSQIVWRVAVEGGDPVKVGEGNSPAVSPQGDIVVLLRRGQIFWAPLDTVREPLQLLKIRGNASSLRWSPDGSQLAFVSTRGNHSFIGVYAVRAKSLRYLAPSIDRDTNPEWSPDGKRIAFIRLPASAKPRLFRAVRSAHPWSILVADVETGEARRVWRADEGTGSAFWGVVAKNQLLWGDGDRIVFPWEKQGWVHLYSVPAQGGSPAHLTPGAFEVEYVTLTPDRKFVLYNSNQDDIDRRHLWQVTVRGGKPVALTRGESIEWSPAMTSDGKAVIFFRSDARRPPHLAMITGGGAPREIGPGLIPRTFPEEHLVVPQAVTFTAADGMRIPGQLFLPPATRKGERFPAVLYFHGGSRRQMLLGWHYSNYYSNAYAMNQYLASRGYVVLSVNYRSGIGYGMEFREALNYGAGGASEYNDVVGAALYLQSRADVDRERIGLWGGSYGGYLTALGLARASHLFAAGVDIHGVHDWNVGIRTFVPDYNKADYPDEARIAFESSPMAAIDSWRSPVLLIHGDDDRNVSFNETVALAESLRERGVDFEQLVFPDDVHDFLLHARWVEAFHASADFFDRKLKRAR